MGSSVNKDVPAYVKVRGNPAKPFGVNTTGIKRLGYSQEVICLLYTSDAADE